MRFGVLGTGMVGSALATKLVSLGHEVTMGARQAGGERAAAWLDAVRAGAGDPTLAGEGTFAAAADFGEVVVNATSGEHCLEALHSAGADRLGGKVLVDVANPLDHTGGFPPSLTVANNDSLGEQIQRAFPDARVVKTLNTVNAEVMVNPGLAPGTNIFLSGNDDDAKQQAAHLLASFGWNPRDIVDLGDISTARGPEMYVALWLRLMRAIGHPRFNVRLVIDPGAPEPAA